MEDRAFASHFKRRIFFSLFKDEGRNVCRKKHNQLLSDDGGGLVKRWHYQLRCVEGDGGGVGVCGEKSLHGCIWITPLDTEDLTDTSWVQEGIPDHWKEMYRPMQNSIRTRKERKGAGLHLHPEVRSWSRGQIPTLGQVFGTEEKHLRLLESAAADLWQSEWNENHRWSLPQLTCQDRDTSPLEHAMAGSWRGNPGWGLCCWLRGDGLRGHEEVMEKWPRGKLQSQVEQYCWVTHS